MSVQVAFCQPSSTGLKFGLGYNHFALRGPGVKVGMEYRFNRLEIGASYQVNNIINKYGTNGTDIYKKSTYQSPGFNIYFQLLNRSKSRLDLGVNFRAYFLHKYYYRNQSPSSNYEVECKDCPYDSLSGAAYNFPDIIRFQIGAELKYSYQFSNHFAFFTSIEYYSLQLDSYNYVPYKFRVDRRSEVGFSGNFGISYNFKAFSD